MKILVIGGSYFFGRVFIMQMRKAALAKAALNSEITVVNRGNYSMESLGVKQVTDDRHNAAIWQQCGDDYDVMVDFCGYNRGIAYTVIRPAFMYGPYNYAPRESVFIGSMVREKRLYRITGCDGGFQCTYVADAAQAGKRRVDGEIFREIV